MRTIEITGQFKRDLKRERRGRRVAQLDQVLADVVRSLQRDESLPTKHVDHALTGSWQGFRDCHVFPDLVLIYSKPDDVTLRLVRLGSHSELSL